MTESLSIVLPAFNEEGNIERAVETAARVAARFFSDWEIVAVDDGSRDATLNRLMGLTASQGEHLKVIAHGTNRGYGTALRTGFQATRGSLVFYTDSDNQFDLDEIEGFLPLIQENDAVLGYRIDRKDRRLRLITSAVFNGLSSFLFGMAVRDLNCSFKLFRGDKLRALPLATTDFMIDTELVARLHRGGWKYVQRGVHHYPRTVGHSTVRARD